MTSFKEALALFLARLEPKKKRRRARAAVEWFTRGLPDDLIMSSWQKYTCRKCGAKIDGDKTDPTIILTLETHVLRHEQAGESLP